MKSRLISYLILLPLLFLILGTDISAYLSWIAFFSLPVCIALIVYALIKTKQFYKLKKCISFLLVIIALAFAFSATPSQAKDLLTRRTEIRQRIEDLGTAETPEQKKELKKLIKEYEKIQKKIGELPCPSSQILYDDAVRDCWACDVADLFIEAGDKVASAFYQMDKEYGYTKSLLVIGLLIWILLRVLKLLMSFGTDNLGSFFTEFFIKLLLVGGVYILLSQPMYKVVDFAISPFFLLSSSLSRSISEFSEKPATDSSTVSMEKEMAKKFGSSINCSYCQALDRNAQTPPPSKITKAIRKGQKVNNEERVISPTFRNAFLCSVCSIYKATVPPTITGQFLTCAAKKENITILKVFGPIYTNWSAIIAGYTLTFIFFLISALFTLKLIDIFLRITMVLIFLPFLIVAYAFKPTFKYTKKSLDILIHSLVSFVFLTLMLVLIVQMFYAMLGPSAAQIADLTYKNDFEGLNDYVGFVNGGKIFFACIGTFIISLLLMKDIDSYIQTLSGVGLSNSGGAGASMALAAGAMTVAKTASNMYSADWKSPSNTSGNSPEDKAAKISKFGENFAKEGKAEQATDQAASAAQKGINNAGNAAAQGIDKAGTSAGKGLMESGKGLCSSGYGAIIGVPMIIAGAAIYGGSKVAATAVKYGSKAVAKASQLAIKHGGRLAIKATKKATKAVAQNKYFNKTVGLAWQAGSDIKNLPKNVKNKYMAARKGIKNFGQDVQNKYNATKQGVKSAYNTTAQGFKTAAQVTALACKNPQQAARNAKASYYRQKRRKERTKRAIQDFLNS